MFEQKLRSQYFGRFGSQIEPNPKINWPKDAHGYCASFSHLIKNQLFAKRICSATKNKQQINKSVYYEK